MKKIRLFLCIIIMGVLLLTSLWVPVSVSASAAGYWQQENVEMQKSDEYSTRVVKKVQLGRGFASVRDEDTVTGDVYADSMVWTEPEATYFAGDIVELTLDISIDSYVWNNEAGSTSNLNYMGSKINARIDEPGLLYGFVGSSAVNLTTQDGIANAKVSAINGEIKKGSDSIKVSAVFDAGSKDGEIRTIYVSCDGGVVRYNYKWIAEPVKNTANEEKSSEESTEKK